MKHARALEIANDLIEILGPHFVRLEIAGSVRRGKPEVKDIELVAVPKMKEVKDLLGIPTIISEMELDQFSWTTIGKVIKRGQRYKQISIMVPGQYPYEEIMLDLFIVLPPAQWGVIYTIRTGPADFSQWCVTKRRNGGALPSDSAVSEGRVLRYGEAIEMPEEIDFLNYLGLGWIEPADRAAGWRKK
jgi:DNA polymerase/3'-5' exonuclease PolX